MITIRKAADRCHFDFGWLDTYHTFSFDQYHDPMCCARRRKLIACVTTATAQLAVLCKADSIPALGYTFVPRKLHPPNNRSMVSARRRFAGAGTFPFDHGRAKWKRRGLQLMK